MLFWESGANTNKQIFTCYINLYVNTESSGVQSGRVQWTLVDTPCYDLDNSRVSRMFPHVPASHVIILFPSRKLLLFPHSVSAFSSFRFMFRATSLLFYFILVANNCLIVIFILVANNRLYCSYCFPDI